MNSDYLAHPPIKWGKGIKKYRDGKNMSRKSKIIVRFDIKFRRIDSYGCEFWRTSEVSDTLFIL